MGYSSDQEGIMQRYINEEGQWNSHLENSQNFIKKVVKAVGAESVAVLGSGWLLDVPIDYLNDCCTKIYLYDIRHPSQIVNRFKKNKKIEFVNMDITGGIIQYIFEQIKNKQFTQISNFPEAGFKPIEPIDLTISLNILNQLDILIVEYLRKFPKVTSEDILTLRKKVQLTHIKSLLTDKSCLISDYEEELYDRTGSLVRTSSLIFDSLPEGKKSEEWIWKFDNRMSYYQNRVTHFKVRAIQL